MSVNVQSFYTFHYWVRSVFVSGLVCGFGVSLSGLQYWSPFGFQNGSLGVSLGSRITFTEYSVTFGIAQGSYVGRCQAVHMTSTDEWSMLVADFDCRSAKLCF